MKLGKILKENGTPLSNDKGYSTVTLPDYVLGEIKKKHPKAVGYAKVYDSGKVLAVVHDPEMDRRWFFESKKELDAEGKKRLFINKELPDMVCVKVIE